MSRISKARARFVRVYGSEERQRTIARLPCSVPGCPHTNGTRHNHHTRGGGTGRKASWQTIVPLCAWHHLRWHDRYASIASFRAKFGVDLGEVAARLAEEYPA